MLQQHSITNSAKHSSKSNRRARQRCFWLLAFISRPQVRILMSKKKQNLLIYSTIVTSQLTLSYNNQVLSSYFFQIFIIPAVVRRSEQRVAGPISAAWRLGYTAAKKRRSGGEPLATLCRFDRLENRTPKLRHR